MRPLSLLSRSGLGSSGVSAAVAVAAVAPASATIRHSACAVRWQSSRPYSRSLGGGRGGNNSGSPGVGSRRTGGHDNPRAPTGPVPSALMNSTGDGELSSETRAALRDDSIVMAEVVKHLSPKGAISVKALFSAIDENIQEALSERHGGLRNFLEQRKQFFVLHTNPEDGVLYVIGNPIVIQQYAMRDAQRRTMRQMMGLDDNNRQRYPQRRPEGTYGHSRGRGGRGGGGGGDRRYQGSMSSSGSSRTPQQQQYRNEGGSGDQGGNSYRRGDGRRGPLPQRDNRSGFGGGSRGRGGGSDGTPRRGGPMRGHNQSFGTR
ncbi:hypothetical protein JKF63_04682 [Porcisia hertigi]|uniref:Uncharacterized protein n=1 Tax=Porcisia hertigi TaxID=2761500 RepID=A0A836L8W6_9TRYP|nr:hypothetical protein JKF63_04682 [Porcisia hertigi]